MHLHFTVFITFKSGYIRQELAGANLPLAVVAARARQSKIHPSHVLLLAANYLFFFFQTVIVVFGASEIESCTNSVNKLKTLACLLSPPTLPDPCLV